MNEWWRLIETVLCIVPIGGVVLLFVKAWMADTHAKINQNSTAIANTSVPRSECTIHTAHFEKELTEMNGELKQSFDKLIAKIDEQQNGQKHEYTKIAVELAKLTQRVDDALRNGKVGVR